MSQDKLAQAIEGLRVFAESKKVVQPAKEEVAAPPPKPKVEKVLRAHVVEAFKEASKVVHKLKLLTKYHEGATLNTNQTNATPTYGN
jgi:hypothetical protein